MIHLPPPYDVRIWQCTDFGRHWHSSLELYICLQGCMEISIEGRRYVLRQNDTVFVAANEAHEIFCSTPQTHVVLIGFGSQLLGNRYSCLQNRTLPEPFFCLSDPSLPQSLVQPLLQIMDVLCKPNEAIPADWQLRSSLYALAGSIAQHGIDMPLSAERSLRAGQLTNMQDTLQYVAGHFKEPITLEQAAAMAGYDRSYFSKQFSKATGMTFHRYLNCCRIRAACHLLKESNLPMSEVAEQTGFASQKTLNRLFRQYLGTTPGQYRKHPPEKSGSRIDTPV